MFGPSFCVPLVSVAEGVFAGLEGAAPRPVWAILSWRYRDEIPDGAAENTHGRGHLGVSVGCISVLKSSTLECISVDITVRSSVVSD